MLLCDAFNGHGVLRLVAFGHLVTTGTLSLRALGHYGHLVTTGIWSLQAPCSRGALRLSALDYDVGSSARAELRVAQSSSITPSVSALSLFFGCTESSRQLRSLHDVWEVFTTVHFGTGAVCSHPRAWHRRRTPPLMCADGLEESGAVRRRRSLCDGLEVFTTVQSRDALVMSSRLLDCLGSVPLTAYIGSVQLICSSLKHI